MELLGVQFPNIPEISRSSVSSYDGLLNMQVDFMNSQHGSLTGYNCPDCLNRGISFYVRNGEVVAQECHCKEKRDSINRIAKSGLKDVLQDYTFRTYRVESNWQRAAKQKALAFIDDHIGKWFFTGGQVGSGKTHLCTAIVGELMNLGKAARYMLWRDEVVMLKACVNDDREYYQTINPLKTVDVLYIDDFFKTQQGKDPTQGDINIAFELLNYRYSSQDLITIISSEKTVDEIVNIDEAIGSRIYQRAKEYCVAIGKDPSKNYRMK